VGGRAADKPASPAAAAAPAAAPEKPAKPPSVIMDPSAKDWVLEPVCGNRTAGVFRFIDGPALQAGGITRPWGGAVSDDGTLYVRNAAQGLVEVTPDGKARLLFDKSGPIEGPAERCAAGEPVWNPKEKTLYMTGPNCLRRVVTKPDGTRWVEVVAGVPGKPGKDDGPARTATITKLMAAPFGNRQGVCDGLFCTSKGVVYFSDDGIRKLENGVVTTVTRKVKGFMSYNEEDDLFYLPAQGVRGGATFDPKTGAITTVVGAKTDHNESNHDGPALVEATFNSNFAYCYWDPFHKALWVFGPDEVRIRWLKDGWVKTVMSESKDLPLCWIVIMAVDSRGRAYGSSGLVDSVVWRLRNTKEVQP
jgi:hypothetical protein